MRNHIAYVFTVLFLSYISRIHARVLPVQKRAADTCADPTLADLYVESYDPAEREHLIQMRSEFVTSITFGNADVVFHANLFRAWKDPQPFTFPLHRLFNPTLSEIIFVVSTDGSAPVVSGFEDNFIPAYVYTTPICDSVPLYAVSDPAVTDHWYTTCLSEKEDMINRWGWTDQGIIAYVLPLYEDGPNNGTCGF